VKKVWMSNKVQSDLRNTGGKWLCDGNKLAWYVFTHVHVDNFMTHTVKRSSISMSTSQGEMRINVDLDAEAGRTLVGRDGVYTLILTKTKTIRLKHLEAYIRGKTSWDSHVLECMSRSRSLVFKLIVTNK
jgi:eukaryotic translation initiation factor 2C